MKGKNTVWLLYLLREIIIFFTYTPLITSVLLGFFFLMVVWINLSSGEPNIRFLGIFLPVLTWLGIGESGSYGNKEIFAVINKVIFWGGFIGIVSEFLIKKLFKIELRFKSWIGFIILTTLFLSGLLSCFSSQAKTGAISTIPVLIVFWLLAMVQYAWYLFLRFLCSVIDKQLEKQQLF